jgi:hypothetical protein
MYCLTCHKNITFIQQQPDDGKLLMSLLVGLLNKALPDDWLCLSLKLTTARESQSPLAL